MQIPFSPLSFGKSFKKIRSAVPASIFVANGKSKKKQKKSVKHICIRLIGGCVNKRLNLCLA